jgi:hypothetical protein
MQGLTEIRILSSRVDPVPSAGRFDQTRRTEGLSIVGASVTIALRNPGRGDAINQNRREDANDSSPHAGCAASLGPAEFVTARVRCFAGAAEAGS